MTNAIWNGEERRGGVGTGSAEIRKPRLPSLCTPGTFITSDWGLGEVVVAGKKRNKSYYYLRECKPSRSAEFSFLPSLSHKWVGVRRVLKMCRICPYIFFPNGD